MADALFKFYAILTVHLDREATHSCQPAEGGITILKAGK